MAMTPDDYERIHNNHDVNNAKGTLYRGKVEDNNDPCGLGRVQVRIAALHGVPNVTSSYTPKSTLPWAHICSLSAGPGRGTVITPLVGDTVWILFEDNDKDLPVVLGSSYGIGDRANEYEVIQSSNGKMFTRTDGRLVHSAGAPGLPKTARRLGDAGQVLYKSANGAEISFNEEDNHNRAQLIDRIGQIVELGTDAPAGTRGRSQGDRYRLNDLPNDAFYNLGYINIQSASNRTADKLPFDSRVYMTEGLCNITNGVSYIHMQDDHIRISNRSPNVFKDTKLKQYVVDDDEYYSLKPNDENEDKKVYYWQININGDTLTIRNRQCKITMTENTLRLENSIPGQQSGSTDNIMGSNSDDPVADNTVDNHEERDATSITRSIIDMTDGELVIKAPHITLSANRIDLNPEKPTKIDNLFESVNPSSPKRPHDFHKTDS